MKNFLVRRWRSMTVFGTSSSRSSTSSHRPGIDVRSTRIPAASAAVVAAALFATLTVAACKTSGSVTAEGVTHLPDGTPISVTGSIGIGQPLNLHNDSTLRFRLQFTNAAGAVVGGCDIPAGGNATGTIPDDATDWVISSEAPSSGGGSGGGGGMFEPDSDLLLDPDADVQIDAGVGGRRAANPEVRKRYFVMGGPLWFDRDSIRENAVYSFTVMASTQDEAVQLSAETVTAPIGSSIDPRVVVDTLFKAYEEGGSAHLVSIAQRPFSTFEVDFNGEINYATLSDGASQTDLGNGVWRIDVPVSSADIHGYDEWNWATFRTQHGNNSALRDTYYALFHQG